MGKVGIKDYNSFDRGEVELISTLKNTDYIKLERRPHSIDFIQSGLVLCGAIVRAFRDSAGYRLMIGPRALKTGQLGAIKANL